MQNETLFKKRVKIALEDIPKSFFIKIQLVSLRGIPDFLGVVRGRFVAIELKVDGNEASVLQSWTLRKIEQCGGKAYVMYPYNMREVLDEIKAIS